MEKKMKSLEELHIAAVREGNNIHLRYLEDCLARRQQLDNAYLTQNY
jgi:hypothetical protein